MEDGEKVFRVHLGWLVAILSDSPGDELKSRP
jgi:hypothetical protein